MNKPHKLARTELQGVYHVSGLQYVYLFVLTRKVGGYKVKFYDEFCRLDVLLPEYIARYPGRRKSLLAKIHRDIRDHHSTYYVADFCWEMADKPVLSSYTSIERYCNKQYLCCMYPYLTVTMPGDILEYLQAEPVAVHVKTLAKKELLRRKLLGVDF